MTDLRCDTLITATYYPIYKWRQILIWLYIAISGDYGNATTGHSCTANEVHARNVSGPGTPHQNSINQLGIIHAQLFPHTFNMYLPRKRSRSNYLGCCDCTTNWNYTRIRVWHKFLSTAVPRQIHPSGIHIRWRHQHCGRIFNKDWNNYWRCLH